MTELNLPRQSKNNDLSVDQANQLDLLLSRDYSTVMQQQAQGGNSTMLEQHRHENLSSILGTDHEVFSIDEEAPPTFRD